MSIGDSRWLFDWEISEIGFISGIPLGEHLLKKTFMDQAALDATFQKVRCGTLDGVDHSSSINSHSNLIHHLRTQWNSGAGTFSFAFFYFIHQRRGDLRPSITDEVLF
jgi:hypothetical protein